MKRIFISILPLLTAAILIYANTSLCNAFPSKPNPERLVNDFAGLFSHRQIESLERVLVSFDDTTSNQIAVVTVTDLEGYSVMEYATQIGLEWKIGSEKFDNGIVLLIKPKTADSRGEVAISVGYGLEGAITDAYSKRIIETIIIPRFRESDYFGGTANACSVLMKLASGEISEIRESNDNSDLNKAILALLVTGFVAILIIISLFGRSGGNKGGRGGYRDESDDLLRGIILGSILSNGSRRSDGGGFGGNSGFGGSFGGGFGGFGGFGGGSFGGGGASGSW